jgi:hypothetical protein
VYVPSRSLDRWTGLGRVEAGGADDVDIDLERRVGIDLDVQVAATRGLVPIEAGRPPSIERREW